MTPVAGRYPAQLSAATVTATKIGSLTRPRQAYQCGGLLSLLLRRLSPGDPSWPSLAGPRRRQRKVQSREHAYRISHEQECCHRTSGYGAYPSHLRIRVLSQAAARGGCHWQCAHKRSLGLCSSLSSTGAERSLARSCTHTALTYTRVAVLLRRMATSGSRSPFTEPINYLRK